MVPSVDYAVSKKSIAVEFYEHVGQKIPHQELLGARLQQVVHFSHALSSFRGVNLWNIYMIDINGALLAGKDGGRTAKIIFRVGGGYWILVARPVAMGVGSGGSDAPCRPPPPPPKNGQIQCDRKIIHV